MEHFSNDSRSDNNSTKFLNDNEENILEKNLVWIFGLRRSGTTWLAKELLSHNTYLWDEPWLGGHLGIMNTVGERNFDKAQIRKNYFFNKSFQDTWLVFLRKLILQRIYSEFKDLSKKIIIKEPNGSLAADIITSAVPKSKFVLVVRDCRDNIDSVLNGMKEGGWRANWQGFSISDSKRESFIEDEAKVIQKTWEILLKAYENHDDDKKYLIRYENLRFKTLEELEKLYKFLGIECNSEILAEIIEKFSFENIPQNQKGDGMSKRSATPGLWKSNLKQNEVEIINKILGPTLNKLGYEKF